MDFATNGPFVSATDLVGGAPPDHDPEAELHHDDAEGTPVDQERVKKKNTLDTRKGDIKKIRVKYY